MKNNFKLISVVIEKGFDKLYLIALLMVGVLLNYYYDHFLLSIMITIIGIFYSVSDKSSMLTYRRLSWVIATLVLNSVIYQNRFGAVKDQEFYQIKREYELVVLRNFESLGAQYSVDRRCATVLDCFVMLEERSWNLLNDKASRENVLSKILGLEIAMAKILEERIKFFASPSRHISGDSTVIWNINPILHTEAFLNRTKNYNKKKLDNVPYIFKAINIDEKDFVELERTRQKLDTALKSYQGLKKQEIRGNIKFVHEKILIGR